MKRSNQYVDPIPYGIPQIIDFLKRKQYEQLFQYVCIDIIWRLVLTVISSVVHRYPHTFRFNQSTYIYRADRYNQSWANERIVEVPIGLSYIKPSARTLEIGRVLSHYAKQTWDVVDKFETGSDVINQDIFDYNPKHTYDRIISLSTIEHIGVDDTTNNPLLGVKAIDKMKSLLNQNGELVISIPVGYNPTLDTYLFTHPKLFTYTYGMKRLTPWNTWKQVSLDDIRRCRYGWPYNNANGLFIGIFKKS